LKLKKKRLLKNSKGMFRLGDRQIAHQGNGQHPFSRLKRITIKTRLRLSSALIMLLFLAFGLFSLYEMRKLDRLTWELYSRPFHVSNAALRACIGVNNMQNSLRQAILAHSNSEIAEAVQDVREAERLAFSNLEVVRDRILGLEGKKLEQESRDLLDSRVKVNREIVKLLQSKDKAAVIALDLGPAAALELRLEQKLLELEDFADNKAKGFMDHAVTQQQRIFWSTIIFVMVTALLAFMGNVKLQEYLCHQALRDPLTGLFNRRFLLETLERELYRIQGKRSSLCVIMLDLDNFKRFNDTFGHAAGDSLLRALGRLLLNHMRKEDVVCRYGGEEFALILPETSLETACNRAEELRQLVHGLHLEHRGKSLGIITISLGVAVYPKQAQNPESLLRAADKALYQAKDAGRDQVVVSG
jgi:diguanylate cyclase (GGDEF)-like protein